MITDLFTSNIAAQFPTSAFRSIFNLKIKITTVQIPLLIPI